MLELIVVTVSNKLKWIINRESNIVMVTVHQQSKIERKLGEVRR
jgi:hypothetical protein